MSGNTTERHGRSGGSEHQGYDQQCPEQQQQPVLKLEPSLVLACCGEEIADRGKNDGRGLAPGQQVEKDWDCRSSQTGQHPRVKKSNHAEREGGVRASRSTTPKGVSVVTR